uniref:uncharacterized protein isoform X2 n=1 Tax=Myxine glutinosa TaxID=7769 RepID=UPI00358F172E
MTQDPAPEMMLQLSAQQHEAKRTGGPPPMPISDASQTIVEMFTEAPNLMGIDGQVETPAFHEEVSNSPLLAAAPVPTSPSAAEDVQTPVSVVMTDHDHDNTTHNSTSASYRSKWRKLSQENVWVLQCRVLEAQREKLLEEKKKIILEKEKFVVEMEKLEMEKEKIEIEKVKLEIEVSLLHTNRPGLLLGSVIGSSSEEQR